MLKSTILSLLFEPHMLAISAVLGVALVYVIYRKALPKPIPGIPYNEESAARISGDIPHFLALQSAGKRPRDFWVEVCRRHNSAITQYFPGPFKKPYVILSDFREVQDLLVRRAKLVDRAPFTQSLWSGAIPNHFIGLPSKHPKYHLSRNLARDLMTPSFLHTVSMPASYDKMLNFIKLWEFKADIADGCPFDAMQDLNFLTSDIITAAALGIEDDESDIARVQEQLRNDCLAPRPVTAHRNGVYPFPNTEATGLLGSVLKIAEAIGGAPTSPNIQLYWYLTNLRPSVRKAKAERDRILQMHINRASHRAQRGSQYRAAVDFIVSRELAAAEKASRPPVLNSGLILDALFGYVMGGQDTTHSVMSFMVKQLGVHQEEQHKLRTLLYEAYPEPRHEGRMPTAQEIIKTHVPYLDGFVEEVMRLDSPAPVLLTQAVEDIVLLGHVVPAGTEIFCTVWGPSIDQPALPVDEALRSKTSQAHRDDTPTDWAYSPFPPEKFHPERWLRKEGDSEVFDIKAGPTLSFSAGPRECWGRRLAYLELKMMATLLVWSFEFLSLPPELVDRESADILNAKPKRCFALLKRRN